MFRLENGYGFILHGTGRLEVNVIQWPKKKINKIKITHTLLAACYRFWRTTAIASYFGETVDSKNS